MSNCENCGLLEGRIDRARAIILTIDRDRDAQAARIRKLEALAEWCKPDEHSPPEHWAAYHACFPV